MPRKSTSVFILIILNLIYILHLITDGQHKMSAFHLMWGKTVDEDIEDSQMRLLSRDFAQKDNKYSISCSNMHTIEIKNETGHGVCKQGFIGKYKNQTVVVKMSTLEHPALKLCSEFFDNYGMADVLANRCTNYCSFMLMREIVFLQEFNHPNLARMLGYCIRSEEMESIDLSQHGVISVFEYGVQMTSGKVLEYPWQNRLNFSIQMSQLLQYLRDSPIGSLRYHDMKLRHFVVIGSQMKMIDIDSFFTTENFCNNRWKCLYGLECVEHQCFGFNAKYNIDIMYKELFRFLLFSDTFPKRMRRFIKYIAKDISEVRLSADEIEEKLTTIRDSRY